MSNLEENYQPFLESLDKLGFCTFRVFEDETITLLKQLYEKNFNPQNIDGLYATHNSNPAETAIQISKAIEEVVSAQLQKVFPDYNYFLGHFMVKGAHVQKEFSLHQDWNIVDESKYKSYQVWIPLQLTYPTNGGLFVVPGSHRFFNNHRSGSYGIPVVPYSPAIEPIVTSVIVPSGNVMIYHNGLFHASHPNHTDENRVAVIANFVQKIAPTYYFHKSDVKQKTEQYAVTGNTLIAHLPDLEKGIVSNRLKLTEESAFDSTENNKITSTDLIEAYHQHFPTTQAKQLKQLHITQHETLENEINKNGFVVLDVMDEALVALFKNEYSFRFSAIDRTPGRFTTLQDADTITKKEVHQFIVNNIQDALGKYFKDYIIPVSQFYTKKAFTAGDIDLHADSTLLLNHQLEPHYAIWIPLVDVDEQNGCMTVIPKSHLNQQMFYGGSFVGRQQEHREWLRQFEIPVPLKAGQALVFDNNLLHNSTANTTSSDRISFTFRMTHFASEYYSFINQEATSKTISLFLETHGYYMDEKWDGEGQFISGKPVGNLHEMLIDFKKEDFVNLPA